MNKDLPQQPQQSEEVDLGQLFKLIGNLFDRLYNFVKSIFKSVLSFFVHILKAIINNFKIIAISMALAGIIGFFLEWSKPPVYFSDMLVKPYFDSKYQLITNINYYNALIKDEDYGQLSGIFDIDEKDAEQILEFDINPGPETENDRILEYEKFIKQVDSSRATNIYFDEFIENRSIYSGSLYQISVKSLKKDIFRLLEDGLNSTFTNKYSIKKREKRDSLIAIDRASIEKSLKSIDSLQNVYVEVLQNEANSENKGTVTLKDGMSLVQERVQTKEYELLTEKLKLRKALAALDVKKIEEDEYFETYSSFQDVGSVHSVIWTKYTFIFPVLAFLLLAAIYIIRKVVLFVKNYED